MLVPQRGFSIAVPAAVLCLLLNSSAWAATITFDTADSQFDTGIANQGWWSGTEPASDNSENYLTGEVSGDLLNSFFTFDLATLDLSGQEIIGATLEVVRYTYGSPDPSETLGLFHVATDAATLNSNAGVNAGIYDDLGSGTSYGSFVVNQYTDSDTETLTFALNAAALADITAAAGGFFSIGGALTSITPDGASEFLFGFSSGDGIQHLVVETAPLNAVPEPTSLLLLGFGLAGLAARRRRARQR